MNTMLNLKVIKIHVFDNSLTWYPSDTKCFNEYICKNVTNF